MSADRTQLIRVLRERLVLAFMKKDFEVVPLLPDEQKSHEVRFAFPLGRLRKTKGDGSIELVEIQLDKHGATKFRLNFGTVPREGVDHPVKHVEQNEAVVHFLNVYGELYRFPFFRKWFSVSAGVEFESRCLKEIDRAVELISEVEAWFATGKVGPHVRRVGITR